MALIIINTSDTFEQWRVKSNTISVQTNDNTNDIGTISTLTTSDKTSVVNSIIELVLKIGMLPSLNTVANGNIVAAINEVLSDIETISGDLSTLTSTDKNNLVAAINSVIVNYNSKIGTLTNLTTLDKNNLVVAINEVQATLSGDITNVSNESSNRDGVLSTLTTTDKTSLVAAINELRANQVTHGW